MPQLELHFFATQIFWLALVFTFIYIFMSWYFIPRIAKIVKSRQDKVEHNLSTAEFLISEQNGIRTQIHKLLEEARAKASEVKHAAFKTSEADLNKFIAQTEKELVKKTAKEEERLARYKIQLQQEIEQVIDGISREIISILLIDSKLNKRTN
jgi:F-type H+-transporting ATPase subunit b